MRLIVSVSGLRSPRTYLFTAGCVTLMRSAKADWEMPVSARYLESFMPPDIPYWYAMYSPLHTKFSDDAEFYCAYERRMNSLKKLRVDAGLSQAALADLAGTTQPQIQRLEKSKRGLTKDWAERLAPHLKVDPQEILFPEQTLSARVVVAPVLGTIQAGIWVEAHIDQEPGRMPIVDTDGYDAKDLYVLRVKGDSMDQFVKDGGYVVCVDIVNAGISFRSGMIVHVQRTRFGGELIETTLKEVLISGREISLIPRSSNSAHKAVRLDENDGDEIEVKGLVLGRYDPSPIR